MFLSAELRMPRDLGIFWAIFPSYGHSSPREEDEAEHIVGQISHANFGSGAFDADGADKQRHVVFLVGEDMLDGAAVFLGGRRWPFGAPPASGGPWACGHGSSRPFPSARCASHSSMSDRLCRPRQWRPYSPDPAIRAAPDRPTAPRRSRSSAG